MISGIQTAGDVRAAELPTQVKSLAENLSKIHGLITIARESNGLHLYMASPHILELEGLKELSGRHLAVNASKRFGLDKWAHRVGTYDPDNCACCMKSKKPYRVSVLQSMPPLDERGYGDVNNVVVVGSLSRKLVPDRRGNMVPPGPGHVIPIHMVPPDNPGRWYLEQRGYDMLGLWEQFQTCWCDKERPASESEGIFYRNFPLGFKSTPQGRIIFFASIYGAKKTWQGRIPESVDGRHKYYWHPYENRWVLCEIKDELTEKWEPIPQIAASPLDWKMPKYRTATHTARNEILMGYDAARAYVEETGDATAFLVEGPLDAARLGAPAVGMIGSVLSELQAALLTSIFRKVVFFPDKGKAGDRSLRSVETHLMSRCELVVEHIPEGVSDPGDLSLEQVMFYRDKHLQARQV